MNTRHNAAAVSFWRHTFRPQYVDHTVNQIAKREYNVRDHLFQSSRAQCQYLKYGNITHACQIKSASVTAIGIKTFVHVFDEHRCC